MKKTIALFLSVFLGGCMGMPKTVQPVADFKLSRYLGKWYEVARLDHPFEKNMDYVTAEYGLNHDGSVSVLNRGFLNEKEVWKEIKGKAKFVDSEQKGYLKVSFFGPFYGSYIIFNLDKSEQDLYQYAFISGPNTNYLWLLSRTPNVSKNVMEQFVEIAKEKGFNTEKIIWVKQVKGQQ